MPCTSQRQRKVRDLERSGQSPSLSRSVCRSVSGFTSQMTRPNHPGANALHLTVASPWLLTQSPASLPPSSPAYWLPGLHAIQICYPAAWTAMPAWLMVLAASRLSRREQRHLGRRGRQSTQADTRPVAVPRFLARDPWSPLHLPIYAPTTRLHAYTPIRAYNTPTHPHTCTHTHLHTYAPTHIRTYTHTYLYTYTHAPLHTYTPIHLDTYIRNAYQLPRTTVPHTIHHVSRTSYHLAPTAYSVPPIHHLLPTTHTYTNS